MRFEIGFSFLSKVNISPKLNDILNECVCQNIRGPTAVNRVNYADGGMLRLVNEGPRARWSQLGHRGCRKTARVTVL